MFYGFAPWMQSYRKTLPPEILITQFQLLAAPGFFLMYMSLGTYIRAAKMRLIQILFFYYFLFYPDDNFGIHIRS